MKQLYKTPESKDLILSLYNEKLESLDIEYENIDVVTSFGRTRVVKTGNKDGNIVFLFHGINAGAPLTLEAVKELGKDYLLFAIDTIGQATMSDENRINIEDNSYALWADEILKKLNIKDAYFIGISYGAYILQKLISYKPELVTKCIFVVPSGLVNGKFGASMIKLTFPLVRFLITKKDAHLKKFIKAFVPEEDEFMFRLQKALLTNLNMDYRRPILLREKDVKNFNNPVYMIVSDNDVFFPGLESIDRAKRIFNNFREAHILKNSKHMPNKEDYFEIQQKIKLWLEE
ncbi:MAG: alpha/beta hydrolase [Bacteroidetes bacterium]|jgi:pimeloyl-ACP methyl ester carboxylesterase|nr:alpha/beta hydrolase [Bacteroidota bacterium]MBK9635852.1 alpha/beta hydrolase [Bacteroidota bacterium]MBL0289023.1 alpha/beta hydrolase [Bacteroidota bacterium]